MLCLCFARFAQAPTKPRPLSNPHISPGAPLSLRHRARFFFVGHWATTLDGPPAVSSHLSARFMALSALTVGPKCPFDFPILEGMFSRKNSMGVDD